MGSKLRSDWTIPRRVILSWLAGLAIGLLVTVTSGEGMRHALFAVRAEGRQRIARGIQRLAHCGDVAVAEDRPCAGEVRDFGAVDESAWVYVNGKPAGEHTFAKSNDWTAPFLIRIDSLISWEKPVQDITVRVEDKGGAGGIWKPVWLVSRSK